MKILIDGRRTFGGIDRYASTLIDELRSAVPPQDLLVFGADYAAGSRPSQGRSTWRRLLGWTFGWSRRIASDQLMVPATARRLGADIFHSTNFFVPSRLTIPAIVTCHDLTLLDHFKTRKRTAMKYYERAAMVSGLRRAAHIVTHTATVATRVRERFGFSHDRVTAIYPALPNLRSWGHAQLPPELDEPPFFLSVGTLEPRKNLTRLLEAHRAVYADCRMPLWLVGPYGWRQRDLLRAISNSNGRARWLGYVEDATLAALYRAAVGVIQYSLDEGFDYPVAEAVSMGTPVVLSDIPVHREIAGDCALYADPRDGDALALQLASVARWTDSDRTAYATRAQKCAETIHRHGGVGAYLDLYKKVVARENEIRRYRATERRSC